MKRIARIVLALRRCFYRQISSRNVQQVGKPLLKQPLLIQGQGKVVFGEKVQIGYPLSPGFWSSYNYFDLRGASAEIVLADGVVLNNDSSLTADGAAIFIGKNTLAGVQFSVMTSDGHSLSPKKRQDSDFVRASVHIGENVFIGDRVTILKGVHIGDFSVIGAGSVVTSNIPEKVVAAGNPCRVIRALS